MCGIGSLRISFPVCGLDRGAVALFPGCCLLTRWGLRMFDVRFDSVLVCDFGSDRMFGSVVA